MTNIEQETITSKDFWEKWTDFRLSDPESYNETHFFDLIQALPFAKELNQWTQSIPNNSHLISLAAGSLAPERLFAPEMLKSSATITAINDPDVSKEATKGLRLKNIDTPFKYIHHNLNAGLPESLSIPIDNLPVHGISIWGITYLKDEPLKNILHQFKKIGSERQTQLDLIMLTGERFDPKVLALKYFTDAFPHAFLHMKPDGISKWVNGLKAVPSAIEFGKEIKMVDDILVRPAQDTIQKIQEEGFNISKMESMLWGQTTAIRIDFSS